MEYFTAKNPQTELYMYKLTVRSMRGEATEQLYTMIPLIFKQTSSYHVY